MRWFTSTWWKYLFERPFHSSLLRTVICRMKGHEDPIWYNLVGLEPDMRCRNCFDYL